MYNRRQNHGSKPMTRPLVIDGVPEVWCCSLVTFGNIDFHLSVHR